MSCIEVQTKQTSETVTINAFVLLEADGVGVRDFEKGYVSNERAAKEWHERSPSYNSYREVQIKFEIHNTLRSFMDQQERDRALCALNKLSREERALLAKHSNLLHEA